MNRFWQWFDNEDPLFLALAIFIAGFVGAGIVNVIISM